MTTPRSALCIAHGTRAPRRVFRRDPYLASFAFVQAHSFFSAHDLSRSSFPFALSAVTPIPL